jgi:hypothetical protein
MTEIQRLLVQTQADHDQDIENFKTWWRETTTAEKHEVLDVIQRQYDDPRMEIMSRLAQFAFTEMALKEIDPATA